MFELVKEGEASVYASKGKISKELPVFYNPVMKHNRDISIALLNSIDNKQMAICDPLAGSGVRGIRFLLELDKGKIENIFFNDMSPNFKKIISMNLKKNKIKTKYKISTQDANLFLIKSKGFDYIDIDPFGTPNPFLDNAIRRLSRHGILAVTSTDTGCLAGTFPEACRRKYWAEPLKTPVMHETGLRILVRKIQLIGAQYDRALTPIFSYFKDHYYRIFFRCEKGKEKADEIVAQHNYFVYENKKIGPMWLGKLFDEKLADMISSYHFDKELDSFLRIIKEESKINAVGFYDIHAVCKKYKKTIPRKDVLIEAIRNKGYKVSETHFTPLGIRSDISMDELIKTINYL